jgi:hypothetical protein
MLKQVVHVVTAVLERVNYRGIEESRRPHEEWIHLFHLQTLMERRLSHEGTRLVILAESSAHPVTVHQFT